MVATMGKTNRINVASPTAQGRHPNQRLLAIWLRLEGAWEELSGGAVGMNQSIKVILI
jgi:hypothetical protein